MSGTTRMASGAMEYLKGKFQRMMGKATGNNRMRAKGTANQAKGGTKYETGKSQSKLDR